MIHATLNLKADTSTNSRKNFRVSRNQLSKRIRADIHDYNNLLQLITGYIQINKQEKAIDAIKNHNRKMETINNLYAEGFIELADLLLRKIKEAETKEIRIEINSEIFDCKESNPLCNNKNLIEIETKIDEALNSLIMMEELEHKLEINIKQRQFDYVLYITS